MSEPYRADNLLDRVGDAATRQVHYDQEMRRERAILDRRLPLPAATSCRSAADGIRAATCSRGPPSG